MLIIVLLISFISAARPQLPVVDWIPDGPLRIESNLGTNFNLRTPVPATTEEFTILESKRAQWISLSTVEKQSTIMKSISWEHLSEDQRLFSMLHELGLNSKWSLERVKDEIARDYRSLRDKVGVKWPIGNVKESDATPQRLLWISIVPDQMLNPIEKGLKAEFTTRHRTDWAPSKVWTFPDYENVFQGLIINRILTIMDDDYAVVFTAAQRQWVVQNPFKETSGLLMVWQLKRLRWSELHEGLQFISLKQYFPGLARMSWDTYQHEAIHNLPALRDLTMLRNFNDAPEELFWILSIPKSQRTQAENGYVNSFGFGHFDQSTSSYYMRHSVKMFNWNDRSLIQKAFAIQLIPIHLQTAEQALWLESFKNEISNTFGKAELPNVMAALPDLQEWMRSYFYKNVGFLTAAQKSWGLKELSNLKSPSGVQSFQDFTSALAMESKIKGENKVV